MKKSAGILLFRISESRLEFLLVHPGGPFWQRKDKGAWTIPKGAIEMDEDPLAAAIREFREETGTMLSGDFIELKPIKQKSGKWVYAWALKKDIDASKITSNSVLIKWPSRSGKMIPVPEIDKAEWLGEEEAKEKINPAQAAFIKELSVLLSLS